MTLEWGCEESTETLALLELLLQNTPHAVDTAKQLCNCSFWKSLERRNTKYATHLRLVTFSLLWHLTKYVFACSSGKSLCRQIVETTETVAIQLLAKASIFKYNAMATNTKRLRKIFHHLQANILLSHLLWLSPRVQSMGSYYGFKRCNVSWGNRMKMGHAVGRTGTLLSNFLLPATFTELKQRPQGTSSSAHLTARSFNTVTEGRETK